MTDYRPMCEMINVDAKLFVRPLVLFLHGEQPSEILWAITGARRTV